MFVFLRYVVLCGNLCGVNLPVAGQSPEEYKRDIEERKRILIRKVGQDTKGLLIWKRATRQNGKIELRSVLCCHLTDSRFRAISLIEKTFCRKTRYATLHFCSRSRYIQSAILFSFTSLPLRIPTIFTWLIILSAPVYSSVC